MKIYVVMLVLLHQVIYCDSYYIMYAIDPTNLIFLAWYAWWEAYQYFWLFYQNMERYEILVFDHL